MPAAGPGKSGHDDAHRARVFRFGVPDSAGDGEPIQSQSRALVLRRHLPAAADLRGSIPNEALPFLSTRVRIVAADRNSPASLAQADLKGPIAILVGRESTGLPERSGRYANQLLSIPIRKEVDSLNAATAANIFLYEAARQRGFRY